MKTEKPSLRSTELSRIHAQRQSAVIATVLQDLPQPIPRHCAKLLSYAPESFDDLRYGAIAAAAWNLHLNQKPITLYTVQEQLARSPAKAALPDLSDIFKFMSLSPMALPPVLLDIECEELWLAYSHRRQATLMHEASEAITANPSMADDISRRVSREIEAMIASARNGDSLPEIICCRSLLSTELQLPALLIDGLLHQGSKLSLGGGSKTFKSWTFLSMAVAVSTGTPWLGFATTRGKVLIVNFEIADCWMRYRVHTVCQAANLCPESGWLDIWNLRGHSAPHSTVIPKIIARAKDLGYAMVIIDPSYKLIGQGDENSASDVGAMMSSFEQITVQTKAAVLFGAHFAKGNASSKEAIDRISGSGVFARDPDCLARLAEQERVLAGRPMPGSRRPAPDSDRSRRRQSSSILDEQPTAAPVVAPTVLPAPTQPVKPLGWEYDNSTGTLASCPDDPTQST